MSKKTGIIVKGGIMLVESFDPVVPPSIEQNFSLDSIQELINVCKAKKEANNEDNLIQDKQIKKYEALAALYMEHQDEIGEQFPI
jgi:hypothetical protein